MLALDLKQLEKVAGDFYNLTKMPIILFDDKRDCLYAHAGGMCPFCIEVRKQPLLLERCLCNDQNSFDICTQTKKTYIYHCHMGLTEAISPIWENGIIIGYIRLGQLLDKNANLQELFAHIMDMGSQFGVDTRLLIDELQHIQVTDNKTISSAVDMMTMCACYLWFNQIISFRTDSLIHHINNYIVDHITEDLSVRSICQYVHISKSALYKLSTKYFNMGISDYIRMKRLQEAEQLLKKGTLHISEVSLQVGIPDSNYFTKLFKKHTGKTPREYIKDLG